MSDEAIKLLENRIKYLEDHVSELVYLASCQGWKFNVDKPEGVNELWPKE